jgi:sortase (surface protein transpeptidase)
MRVPSPPAGLDMARRMAIVVGALSVVAAIVIAAALMVRSPHVSHVGALGTIAPAATTTSSATTATQRSSPASTRATYPTATTVPPPALPTTINIPSLKISAPIVAVGLDPGTNNLQIPDIDHVGWYQLGPSPGQIGSAVLVGHVDGNSRPGVFWHLGRLTPGDRITINYNGTSPRTFRVTGRQQVPKTQLPAELFSRAGPSRIALITCGGTFNTTTRHYQDNVVIVATPN